MKDIAHHRHAGLRGRPIAIWVFTFGLVISLIGASLFKNIDDSWSEVIQKTIPKDSVLNAVSAISLTAISVACAWSLLIAGFAFLFRWVLTWQTTYGWPRYFFYAFKFADGQAIAGWMRITLDPSNGTLHAMGKSFQADGNMTGVECVPWKSDIVSGGTFREQATCYILYSLNPSAAERAKRPYRDGLLRFRLLKRDDLKEDYIWPEPSQLGEEQYFGHQQAVDRDKMRNLAYAESAVLKGKTDKEIENALTHELIVRRESLLAAMASLERNLKDA